MKTTNTKFLEVAGIHIPNSYNQASADMKIVEKNNYESPSQTPNNTTNTDNYNTNSNTNSTIQTSSDNYQLSQI